MHALAHQPRANTTVLPSAVSTPVVYMAGDGADNIIEFGGRGRGGPRYGGDRDSYDRRGGGYGRRDDYGSRSSRYDDRGYGAGRRDDYPRGVDRYASERRYDRRGGGGDYYDRPPPPAAGAYDAAPPRDAYSGGGGSGGRSYNEGDYDRSYR